jgi:hypothetical protein
MDTGAGVEISTSGLQDHICARRIRALFGSRRDGRTEAAAIIFTKDDGDKNNSVVGNEKTHFTQRRKARRAS